MNDTTAPSALRCLCGATYDWVPPQAGSRVRCWCGRQWRIPGQRPEGRLILEPLTIDTQTPAAALTPCPMCRKLRPIMEPFCVHCGYDTKAGQFNAPLDEEIQEEPAPQSFAERYRRLGMDMFKNRETPLAMLSLSTLVLAGLFVFAHGPIGALADLGMTFLAVGIATLWMIAAGEVLNFFTGIELGPLHHQVLKFAAIYLFTLAGMALADLAFPFRGALVLLLFRPILFYFLFAYFFDLPFIPALGLALTFCFAEAVCVPMVI